MLFTPKTKILLDTSTLLLLHEGVDIFTLSTKAMDEPHILCIHEAIYKELEKLMVEKTKRGFAAKLAYVVTKQKALKTVTGSSHKHPDDALVEAARPKTTVIATQDKKLAKRAHEKGVKTLRYYRGAFHLEG